MKTIFWVRSDLRIFDNEALSACFSDFFAADPDRSPKDLIFVIAQTQSQRRAGPLRNKFREQCVSEFATEVLGQGFTLLVTEKLFSEFLPGLSTSHRLDRVYFNREHAWEERQEEQLVENFCGANQIKPQSFEGGTLLALSDLPFSIEEMPFIFTHFRKRVESQLRVRPALAAPFACRESKGLSRLNHYLWQSNAVQRYRETRNGMIAVDDSSKLSPWLNAGVLSARTVYHELKRYEAQVCQNESTYWLFVELLWRDYFKFFSLKFGKAIFLSAGISPGTSANRDDSTRFRSWCEGRTDDEFVNANMNELNSTGWMSNRGRQNVASYLIHDLGLNWTWGAAYFEKMLIDYDPDLNWGNWLYLSGRGSDPRARKFDTTAQARLYDPDHSYRKLWGRK